jgi:hypothetical protein
MTDPSHPDHIAAGCKEGATARECPGSVLLVLREVAAMADDGVVDGVSVKRYLKERKRGLTKTGIAYWVMSRIQFGGVPFIGGPRMPEVEEDEGVSLPGFLKEGG